MAVVILGNFDTGLKDRLYRQNIAQYTEAKVLLLTKSTVFFLFRVLLPIIAYVIVWLFMFVFFYFTLTPFLTSVQFIQLISIFSLLYIVFTGYDVFITYIDYTMSFYIINPEHVVGYTQKGVFTRKSINVNTQDIKSIKVSKIGFLTSLFDMGDIMIVLEGEEQSHIIIDYILNPEAVVQKTEQIIRKERRAAIAP